MYWQKVGRTYIPSGRAHEKLKEGHFSRIVNSGPHLSNFTK